MPVSPPPLPVTLWVLLSLVLVLQIVLIVISIGQSRRLRRLEQPTAAAPESDTRRRESSAEKPSGGEIGEPVGGGGELFRQFLAEDPSRGELPKKEQFAAFRRWRNEKGLNWGS